MGWLLSIVLLLPHQGGEITLDMWFSQEYYCAFAREKFQENPVLHRGADGTADKALVVSADCRRLDEDEGAFVPAHVRAAQ